MKQRGLPVSLFLLAVSACAAERPSYPSDLEYRYVPLEKGAPPVAEKRDPLPIVPGLSGAGAAVGKERIVKPRTDDEAMRNFTKHAMMTPKDCDNENVIMVCPYRTGKIYRIYVKAANIHGPRIDESGRTVNPKADPEQGLVPGQHTDRPGKPSLVMLQPGEIVENIGFENSDWFSIPNEDSQAGDDQTFSYGEKGASRVVIPVRGWKAGECTDMYIMTNRRPYILNVCANVSSSTYAIAWNYRAGEVPEGVYEPPRGASRSGAAGESGEVGLDQTLVDPARLEPYEISGAQQWLPEKWKAFHDGEVLHLIPPPELVSRPVPFIRRGDAQGIGRWDLSAKRNYMIYGRPAEVLIHEGNPEAGITFRARR